ncbi:HAD family hydrolase [Janibacter sp. G1551]|uniref:HAD family hydrolase n=1 Tax=Janibacter sp. G1551 TaxID=3420440 RepID=UPI003D06768D
MVSEGDGGLRRSDQLVVFDCDGVLVDSERLNVGIWTSAMRDLGLTFGPQDAIHHFLGRAYADNRHTAAALTGREVPPEWESHWRAEFRRSHDRLEAIPGIAEALDDIVDAGHPVCVASGSIGPAIVRKLEVTGLDRFFGGRYYSAEEVERGKPAPDVFLHAAADLGFAPSRCVVVEDSDPGVAAARAAGMPVVGYRSDLTPAGGLADADVVIDDMRALPAALASLG